MELVFVESAGLGLSPAILSRLFLQEKKDRTPSISNILMQRLDSVYMTRVSEAPLLKEKPSHYMRRMFYCSQPLEQPEDKAALAVAFRAINAETQLVWGSNFPAYNFDVPATIWDLPFLDENAKKAILGGNAVRLFGFKNGSHG